jgi:hypothetical protein
MSDQEAKDEDLDEIMERGMVPPADADEVVDAYFDDRVLPTGIRSGRVLFAPVDAPSDISDVLNKDGTPKSPWRDWPRSDVTIETFSRAWEGDKDADPIADLKNAQRRLNLMGYGDPLAGGTS